MHEDGPRAAYQASPDRSPRSAPAPVTPNSSQIGFLAPEDATFIHEVRQLAARAAVIYNAHRPDGRTSEIGIALQSAADVYEYLRHDMAALPQEQMRALTLTMKNNLMADRLVYQGTINASPVRVAEVFRLAIVDSAASIIIVHNHPSGDPTPSQDDLAITRQLSQAGDLFDIELIDHIIIGRDRYVSLRERGHMPPRRK